MEKKQSGRKILAMIKKLFLRGVALTLIAILFLWGGFWYRGKYDERVLKYIDFLELQHSITFNHVVSLVDAKSMQNREGCSFWKERIALNQIIVLAYREARLGNVPELWNEHHLKSMDLLKGFVDISGYYQGSLPTPLKELSALTEIEPLDTVTSDINLAVPKARSDE